MLPPRPTVASTKGVHMRLALTVVACSLVSLLAACRSSHRPTNAPPTPTISQTDVDRPVEGRPRWLMPIRRADGDAMIIPFAVESQKSLFEIDDPYRRDNTMSARNADYYNYIDQSAAASTSSAPAARTIYVERYVMRDVRWHNALLRSNAGESLVLNQRGIIGNWGLLRRDSATNDFIGFLFIAVVNDTNRDGQLDNRDARQLMATDATGLNPRVISPANAQAGELLWDATNGVLYFIVRHDRDNDGKFTPMDVSEPFRWLPGEAAATALVPEQYQEAAARLLR